MPDFNPSAGIQIDAEYFKKVILDIANSISERMPHTFDNCDGGLYVGCAGVAYMYYYIAISEPYSNLRDEMLVRAKNYADVALSYAMGKRSRDPPAAFLLGGGGVFVVSSLIYNAVGQKDTTNELNKKYRALAAVCQPIDYLGCGSDEFLVGRAGYLAGAIELKRIFGEVIYNINFKRCLFIKGIHSRCIMYLCVILYHYLIYIILYRYITMLRRAWVVTTFFENCFYTYISWKMIINISMNRFVPCDYHLKDGRFF